MIEFLIRGWDLETVGRDRDNCKGGGRCGERALPQLKGGLVMSADLEYMELMLGRLPHTAAPVPGPFLPPEEWPGLDTFTLHQYNGLMPSLGPEPGFV